jgi:nucleotide-binding universal stress UspA family protein
MYERIVVGTDGSETATRAVETAAEVARAWNAALCVTAAYAPKLTPDQRFNWEATPEDARWRLSAGSMADEVVQEAVRRARAAGGPALDVDGRAEPGNPADVILRVADAVDAGMVIVGNRDMTGWGRLRGSVGHTLTRRAACDVLVVDTVGALAGSRGRHIPMLARPSSHGHRRVRAGSGRMGTFRA